MSRSGPLAQYGPTFVGYLGGADNLFDVEAWVSPGNAGELSLGFSLMRPSCSTADLSISGGRLQMIHDSRYEACDQDRNTMQEAISFISDVVGERPIHETSAGAMNHYVGSCKLGDCLDPKTLLVKGTDNVFIADASLVPSQIWGHPAFTLTAIALRAADILEQHVK